jgi:hypothetical protein
MTPEMIVPNRESSGFFMFCPSCLVDALSKGNFGDPESVNECRFSWPQELHRIPSIPAESF